MVPAWNASSSASRLIARISPVPSCTRQRSIPASVDSTLSYELIRASMRRRGDLRDRRMYAGRPYNLRYAHETRARVRPRGLTYTVCVRSIGPYFPGLRGFASSTVTHDSHGTPRRGGSLPRVTGGERATELTGAA